MLISAQLECGRRESADADVYFSPRRAFLEESLFEAGRKKQRSARSD